MSIRLRLTLYWAIVTAAILLTAGLLILFSFSRQLWSTLDRALLEEADTSAAALSQSNDEAIAILRHLAAERDLGPGRRVRLMAGNKIIFDEGDQKAALPAGAPAGSSGAVMPGDRGSYHFAMVPFQFHGKAAVLQDGVDASPVMETVARLRRVLLLIMPLILGLCVAGGYWLSAWALRPVSKLADTLSRMGPQDPHMRLPVPQVNDETRRLTDAINELLFRIERFSNAQRRFISEAAHELRTPLTVLRSGLEVTLRRPRSAQESREALLDALVEVERLCSTAEDLLTLARIDAAHEPPRDIIDLVRVVEAAADQAKTLASSRQQTLEIEADGSLPVRGNGRELERVVLNLLDNAVKFGKQHGRIDVIAKRENCNAWLSVRDDGPGIGTEELSRMFDPFYRSPKAGSEGSGLGLSLCREIIRVHGGEIRAANRPSGGCEISVLLPLADA